MMPVSSVLTITGTYLCNECNKIAMFCLGRLSLSGLQRHAQNR